MNVNNGNNDVAGAIGIAGPCDNRTFYERWIEINPLYRLLFLRNVDLWPLTGSWDHYLVLTVVYMANIGKGLSLNANANTTDYYVLTMADMMGPAIPANKVEGNLLACNTLIASVNSLLASNRFNSYTTGSREEYLTFNNNPDADLLQRIAGLRYTAEEFLTADWPENSVLTDAEAAMRVLVYLASSHTRLTSRSGLGVITHTYVSILKRGTVSVRFCDKIRDGIQTDLSKTIEIVEDVIPKFYHTFGAYINDTNIASMVDHWISILPQHALRLMLTVQQAAGSGLTAFMTIGRAMKYHPNFPWNQIEAIYPTEFVNYQAALTTVNGNIWYGFRRDLGPVRSTEYKSLAYVAKELLVKVNGEIALNSYGGWPKRVGNQGLVDTLVAAYETAANTPADAVRLAVGVEVVNAIRNDVLLERNNILFQ